MDKILTVQEPYASALVHGLDAKKRMFPSDLFMEAVGG
jgi:hypothetical protein